MTDLSYKAKWKSVICLDNWLSPNDYSCKVHFDIETDNGDEQNIAFERCKVFFDTILHQSLIINIANPLLQILQKKTEQRIITIPNDPLDLVIGNVIYHKLNAITDGRISVQQVDIKSSQGDNIWIHFDQDFSENSNLCELELFKTINETPWWYRNDASHTDWFEHTKKEVKFHKHTVPWDKDLLWNQKDAKVERIQKWKPTIIDGGKTQH